MSPFDKAQKIIDDSAPVAWKPQPEAPQPKPEVPASSPFHFDMDTSAVSAPTDPNAWMKAFEEPASSAPTNVANTPAETTAVKAVSTPDVQPDVFGDVFGRDSAAPSEPAKTAAKKEEDSVSRMRRLFKENSLLQKQKHGRHLVSVKLHRSM